MSNRENTGCSIVRAQIVSDHAALIYMVNLRIRIVDQARNPTRKSDFLCSLLQDPVLEAFYWNHQRQGSLETPFFVL